MWIEIIIFIVIFLALAGLYHLLFPLFFGAPFQRTKRKNVETAINFLKIKKRDKVLECGSGNLYVAKRIAKKGANVKGYEINFLLYLYSEFLLLKSELRKLVSIKLGNFFSANFKKYNKIYFFGFPNIIEKFSEKASKECKKGTLIVSNYWELKETKKLKLVKSKDKIYLYKIK